MTTWIVIASRPRCGTHMLRTAIGSVPGCVALDEVFHPVMVAQQASGFWNLARPDEWLREQVPDSVPLAVLVVHDVQRSAWGGALRSIRALQPHVVILFRRDLLAQWTSHEIADLLDAWQTDRELPPADMKLTAASEKLDLWCRRIRLSIDEDRHAWPADSQILVAYEDLVADLPGQLVRIGRLVGLDLQAGQPATIRRELRPLDQVVTNYAEARQVTIAHALPW